MEDEVGFAFVPAAMAMRKDYDVHEAVMLVIDTHARARVSLAPCMPHYCAQCLSALQTQLPNLFFTTMYVASRGSSVLLWHQVKHAWCAYMDSDSAGTCSEGEGGSPPDGSFDLRGGRYTYNRTYSRLYIAHELARR